jgi:hypothetical protein
MKYKLITASLALLFVLAVVPAYGDDGVYYCSEIDSNGFYYNEKSGSYERSRFKSSKFKIKLNRAVNSIEIQGHHLEIYNYEYHCNAPFSRRPEQLSCSAEFTVVNFNTSNGRFVKSLLNGYVNSDGDSLIISYGKCDKF